MQDDLHRYVEHLQRQLQAPGTESIFDHRSYLEWAEKNKGRLRASAEFSGTPPEITDEFEKAIQQYVPRFAGDNVWSDGIFVPIVERAIQAARRLGLAPKRKVIFANSTSLSLSPSAVPSTGDHIVFAGLGTSSFCNYCAKLFAAVGRAYAEVVGPKPFEWDALANLPRKRPELALNIGKFIGYCRFFGTAVGYGVMPCQAASADFRLQLVNAMETFAVGHEIGHCLIEEARKPETFSSIDEELLCDKYGLSISREIGNARKSVLHFSGAGAITLLRLAELCFPTKSVESTGARTHPDIADRIRSLTEHSLKTTAPDQVHFMESCISELTLLGDLFAIVGDEVAKVIDSSKPRTV